MERLYLRVRAPFAAFRGMQAGVYRNTAPTMPPSAVLGLILNLAGIEMRGDDVGTTLIRDGVPRLRVAIGNLTPEGPSVSMLYQQLHSYPVGASGKELKERTHGAKFWIAPARREVLVDFDVLLAVEALDSEVLHRACRGLGGQLSEPRYGLPFAGDNNFLFDRIDVLDVPPAAYWYTRVNDEVPRPRSCRLTVGINRQDSSQTTFTLVAPEEYAVPEPPESAWTWVPNPPG